MDNVQDRGPAGKSKREGHGPGKISKQELGLAEVCASLFPFANWIKILFYQGT